MARVPITETEPPQAWLLGAMLPVTLAWMGLGMALVVAAGLVIELIGRRQVRRHLLTLDAYLPRPTPWQRSADLVAYNQGCYRTRRRARAERPAPALDRREVAILR
jgi:hypothetical protein